jgi:multiple sugar transport system substrate-binding protein
MKARYSLIALAAIAIMLLAACGQPAAAPAAQPATEATKAPEPTAVPVVQDFITWYQFDQTNTDPANDEAVGNTYLRETIPQFNAAYAGKWNWVNVPKAFDKMTPELVAAVQAGAEVPDVFYGAGGASMLNLVRNGAVQDLTDWAKAQPWYTDVDPNALASCTGPDGRLYCVPIAEVPSVVFVWADRFPNGFPKTPEQFLAEAARLKAEGHHIMTYFGSTASDGEGAGRAVWTAISSFGGAYSDDQGNMLLNTPENVAAIEFLRELTKQEYVPEVVFAGGFQEEEAFKDASAASIPTGLFGYRYIRPLTAPDGTKYTKETEEDMLDAIEAGDVIVSPFIAPEGQKPGGGLFVQSLFIPTGAKNGEAAYDYINWLMTDLAQNADWAARAAAGIPTRKAAFDQPQFQTKFYQQAKAVLEASALRPSEGTLERFDAAKPMIMNVVYKLVKEDLTADIASELQKVQDEYNANK